MSDILKQLRDPSVFGVSRKDTADYIEELEKRNASLEVKLSESEALLAKAVEALEDAEYELLEWLRGQR